MKNPIDPIKMERISEILKGSCRRGRQEHPVGDLYDVERALHPQIGGSERPQNHYPDRVQF